VNPFLPRHAASAIAWASVLDELARWAIAADIVRTGGHPQTLTPSTL